MGRVVTLAVAVLRRPAGWLAVAAVAGVGAGVGSAAGGTVGVLELAAQGSVTALSAGAVIAAGAVAGAALFLAGYGVYRHVKNKKTT